MNPALPCLWVRSSFRVDPGTGQAGRCEILAPQPTLTCPFFWVPFLGCRHFPFFSVCGFGLCRVPGKLSGQRRWFLFFNNLPTPVALPFDPVVSPFFDGVQGCLVLPAKVFPPVFFFLQDGPKLVFFFLFCVFFSPLWTFPPPQKRTPPQPLPPSEISAPVDHPV